MSLDAAVARAHGIMADAMRLHPYLAVLGLFSGGNDSAVASHVSLPWLTSIAHVNTGIGIPDANRHARQVAAHWGTPFLELVTPPEVYEGILFAPKKDGTLFGFPGPAAHDVCYWYLKERRLRELRRRFIRNPRVDRVLFVTGIRKSESARRMRLDLSVPIRREGSTVWVSPILYFESIQVQEYIDRYMIPRSPVADLLHKSGECLCGAFAKSEELKEIEFWYPAVGARIRDLERRLREAGAYRCEWGVKKLPPTIPDAGPLCSSCQLDFFQP